MFYREAVTSKVFYSIPVEHL